MVQSSSGNMRISLPKRFPIRTFLYHQEFSWVFLHRPISVASCSFWASSRAAGSATRKKRRKIGSLSQPLPSFFRPRKLQRVQRQTPLSPRSLEVRARSVSADLRLPPPPAWAALLVLKALIGPMSWLTAGSPRSACHGTRMETAAACLHFIRLCAVLFPWRLSPSRVGVHPRASSFLAAEKYLHEKANVTPYEFSILAMPSRNV